VLVLHLVDGRAKPVTGVRWSIRGHMTHPGMQPVEVEVTPAAEGRYEARLSFTMAGDWILLARADWPEGNRLERSIPVRVRP
jgi:hypothetical protein